MKKDNHQVNFLGISSFIRRKKEDFPDQIKFLFNNKD
jgi:hypothetical protein